MQKIAVLTSGGDAPGMNACIRAIVLTGEHFKLEVYGYRHGYNGLLEQEYLRLKRKNVANIMQRGGTILRSARCPNFKSEKAAKIAAKNLNALGIEALLVIGGDGSFRGAKHLSEHWQGKVIGLPGTIDNDIDGTDDTIGYATAIETAIQSIDKVRDTADAFERMFLVEVMGRDAGFIGLSAAIASASDKVLVPELCSDIQREIEDIITHVNDTQRNKGSASYIVVTGENMWPDGITELAKLLEQRTGIECRPVILGHVQRGGSPVSHDRILASKLGAFAVETALAGHTAVMVGQHNNQLLVSPLEVSKRKAKTLDPYLVKIQQQFF